MEGKFFTGEDLTFEIELGREYLTSDIPASVLLYKVDRKKTKTHSLYGETRASEKVVHDPIEIQVRLTIEENNTEYIGNSTIPKHYSGNLTFTVYSKELDDKNLIINIGDYIGLRNTKGDLVFYEVFDNDNMNVSNSKTIAGLEAVYKTIRCTQVDRDQFNG